MVDEADLVTRFNNFKQTHKDATWKEVCNSIMLQLLQLRMEVEEMKKGGSKSPEKKTENKQVGEPENEAKKSWFGKSVKKDK